MRIKAKDANLISVLGDFLLNYLPNVRNRDDDTILSYRTSINLFLQYLLTVHNISIKSISADDFNQKNIISFMEWLRVERKNVAPTVNHRLSDLRGLCKYFLKKKVINEIVFEEIREINDLVDDRHDDFSWLSIPDTRIVLEQAKETGNPVRDHYLLSIMYESGARVDEILSLRMKDFIPTKNGEVDVHFFGKGRKHRITPLSSTILDMHQRYVVEYHQDMDSATETTLFYTNRNGKKNKMSSDNVSRILKQCELSARQTKPELIHLHSHLFRRSRAMHLYLAGVPLPTISDWLGHTNIETTRFYAKVTLEMKRDALNRLSESESSVFKNDVAFKYAGDEEVLMRLCGLK